MKPKCTIRRTLKRYRNAYPVLHLIFVLFAQSNVYAGVQNVSLDVDWETFMDRHDLIWQDETYNMAHKKSRQSNGGAFMGNGMIGAQVFYARSDTALVWRLGRQDAYGMRNADSKPEFNHFGIGDVIMPLTGEYQSGTIHMDLWNASISGSITTSAGEVSFRTFTHANDDVIYLSYTTTGGVLKDDVFFAPLDTTCTQRVDGDWVTCIQPYSGEGNGDISVAWKQSGGAMYLSVGSANEGSSLDETKQRVSENMAKDLAAWEAVHKNYWHAFYQRHFFSIPETKLESLYWIGVYRAGCLWRPGGLITDNSGVWPNDEGRWNHLTCDMNAQVQYLPLFASNYLDLSQNMINAIDSNIHNLSDNMSCDDPMVVGIGRRVNLQMLDPGHVDALNLPRRTIDDIPLDIKVFDLDPSVSNAGGISGERLANFGWLLHDYYQHYRMAMDEQTGKNCYKLLKMVMRGFVYKLGEKAGDGYYHLPSTYSPEIGVYDQPDANYGLSVIRWAVKTIKELNEKWELNDTEIAALDELIGDLTPYPQNANGYLVYPNLEVGSHRHWSHLLMIYPLNVVNWDNPDDRNIMKKSIDWWTGRGMQDRPWSMGAAVSMYANMRDAQTAHHWLLQGMGRLGRGTSWGAATTFLNETPLIFVRSLQDMALQSWGGTIRVFPAIPDAWADVSFYDMRAQGDFSVSAARENGAVSFIAVTSNAGERCRIWTDMARPIEVTANRELTITDSDDNLIEIDLRKGESALLHSAASAPQATIAPVASDGWVKWWGDKRKKKDDVVSAKVGLSKSVAGGITVQQRKGAFHVRLHLDAPGVVEATLVDTKGRVISRLAKKSFAAGAHEFVWRGGTSDGRSIAKGTYIVSIAIGNRIVSKSLAMVR